MSIPNRALFNWEYLYTCLVRFVSVIVLSIPHPISQSKLELARAIRYGANIATVGEMENLRKLVASVRRAVSMLYTHEGF